MTTGDAVVLAEEMAVLMAVIIVVWLGPAVLDGTMLETRESRAEGDEL